MKQRGYHNQAVKRHYGGELRGLSHSQLYRQRPADARTTKKSM
jgi:hypothetical protein